MIIFGRRWIAPSQRCSCWPKHIPLNLLSIKPLLLFLASLFPSNQWYLSCTVKPWGMNKHICNPHHQWNHHKVNTHKCTQTHTGTHTASCQNKGSWSWVAYKIRLKTVLASLILASCLLGFASLWQTQMQMIWRYWKSWTHVSKVQK